VTTDSSDGCARHGVAATVASRPRCPRQAPERSVQGGVVGAFDCEPALAGRYGV